MHAKLSSSAHTHTHTQDKTCAHTCMHASSHHLSGQLGVEAIRHRAVLPRLTYAEAV